MTLRKKIEIVLWKRRIRKTFNDLNAKLDKIAQDQ